MDCAVRAHRERLDERVGRLWRPHGERDDLGPVLLAESRGERQRQYVVGIDLVRHTLTHHAARLVVELEHRDYGHLLYADGDLHDLTTANTLVNTLPESGWR